jgi:hypothetical protein
VPPRALPVAHPGLTRAIRFVPLLTAAACLPTLVAFPVEAQPQSASARAVLLVILDRVAFEEVMAVPDYASIATMGGAALMTGGIPAESDLSPYAVLGGGTSAPEANPAALARAVQRRGMTVCAVGGSSSVDAPFRPELLLAGLAQRAEGGGCGGSPAEQPDPSFPGGLRMDPGPILSLIGDIALSLRSSEGSALMIVNLGDTYRVDRESSHSVPEAVTAHRRAALSAGGELVRQALLMLGEVETLALVVTPSPSSSMDRVGDEVTPLVMAAGPAGELPRSPASPGTLTSPTTRLDGLVSIVDVAPTVLSFLGISIPAEMAGRPIRMASAGAPFDLHERHLAQRRVRIPIQVGSLVLIIVSALFVICTLAAMGSGHRVSTSVRTLVRWVALGAMALVLVLLVGGSLPSQSYAFLVPVMALAVLALVAAALASGRGPLEPVILLGAAGLVVIVVDATLNGPFLRQPLLGGTAFDGVRFYGLPNAFIATLLAGAVLGAYWLRDPFHGTLLLIGAGLFAGFPRLGANLGASATLFVAAGLWWVLRTRTGFGVREVAFVAGVAALGLGTVLLANRHLPGPPTHIGQFAIESQDEGWRSILETMGRRLSIGARQLADQPGAAVPLAGLPVLLWVALRPPGPIGHVLRSHPAWRHVLVTLTAGSILAYIVEDTGVAAAAPGFLYAVAWLAYAAMQRAEDAQTSAIGPTR